MMPAPPYEELIDGEVRLRPPRVEEAGLYAGWWGDEEVQFGFCSEGRSPEEIVEAFPELESEAADTGHWLDYVIEVAGRPVGYVWLCRWDLEQATAELNILIGEQEWRGRGLARRAIGLLARWAFGTLGLRRILLCPREDHVPAIRSYQAIGARLGPIQQETMTWCGETVCFREMVLDPGGLI